VVIEQILTSPGHNYFGHNGRPPGDFPLVVANSIGGVQDEAFLELGRRIRPPEFTAMPAELREVSPSYRAGNPDGTRRHIRAALDAGAEVGQVRPRRGGPTHQIHVRNGSPVTSRVLA
jgi:hypothetical protein